MHERFRDYIQYVVAFVCSYNLLKANRTVRQKISTTDTSQIEFLKHDVLFYFITMYSVVYGKHMHIINNIMLFYENKNYIGCGVRGKFEEKKTKASFSSHPLSMVFINPFK